MKSSFSSLAIFYCLFLILTSIVTNAQELPTITVAPGLSISGVVKDVKTGEPLPYCNVYFSRSLKGTYTGEDGSFTLSNVTEGEHELVVSFVGYQTKSQIIDASKDIDDLTIRLVENTQALADMEVVIKRDKEWENQLKKFERDLLGEIPMSRFCEIANPWVVSFTGDKNEFIATADEPLEIINSATGFKMAMNLEKFVRKSELFDYKGYFHFEILKSENERQESKWIQNRKTAYLGSVSHFLRSLVENSTDEAGFKVKSADRGGQSMNIYKDRDPKLSELITIKRVGDLWQLNLKEPVLLEYQYEYYHGETQLSLLTKSPGEEILFNSYGILSDPSTLKIGGYLAEEGLTTLLPEEYLIDGEDLIKKRTNLAVQASIINSFTRYAEHNPLKVFIRTDKESYYTGETIWLRAYLLNAINHRPKYERDLIHVELLDQTGTAVRHHRLKSINSGANGSINLPDSIPSGQYILRGYTQASETFVRPIEILSFEDENLAVAEEEEPSPFEISFFPEGGELVAGIKSQVAFQANADFNATLYSEKGKKITSFSPSIGGMGMLDFRPDAGKKYYVSIDETEEKYWLPDVREEGVTIQLKNDEPVEFDVTVSEEYSNTDLYVLIHNAGRLFFFQNINVTRAQEFSFPLDKLSDGINHITVFDDKKRPVAERLFYIPLKNQQDTMLHISMDKTTFSNREKVRLELATNNIQDSTFTDLSISVVDLSQSGHPVDIIHYLKLFADTDLPVPTKHAYKFLRQFQSNPNLFMAIYGWKRFTWNEFLYPDPKNETIEGIAVKGAVSTKSGKPFAETEMILMNQDNGDFYSTTTDQLGNFTFENLNITDTTHLLLKVMDTPGMLSSVDIQVDSSSQIKGKEIPQLRNLPLEGQARIDPVNTQLAFERSQIDAAYLMLNEVVVSGRREEKIDPRKQALGKGNYSLDMSEIKGKENFGHVYDIIRGRVPSLTFVRANRGMDPNAVYVILRGYTNPSASYASQAALILVDNVPMSGEHLGTINPNDIESVEVFTGPSAAVYGARGQNGVIAFFTKRGASNSDINSDPLTRAFIYRNAYYAYETFQHPDYSLVNLTDDYKDLRSTVYWNPNITLINSEKEILTFYTTDRNTELMIDIQGVNQKGELIHETKVIEVINQNAD